MNLDVPIDKVVSMQFSQHGWTCVDSTFLINLIPTLTQQWVINIESTQLYQRCFVNVETTSINIRRLNFHFQSNFNVETTLVHRRWIDVILSTLFQCSNNVDKCRSAQLWTLTINVVLTLIQRWCVCWIWALQIILTHTTFSGHCCSSLRVTSVFFHIAKFYLKGFYGGHEIF